MKKEYVHPELEIVRFNETIMTGDEPVSTIDDDLPDGDWD